MTSPWLSVVLPTFDGAEYLAAALDSVVIQRDDAIEVIAVDDGSSDGTLDILRRYQSRLPLRIIERGRVGSWVANSDYAMRRAAGRYGCFLHQDDFWDPGRLAELRERVQRAPDTVLWLHPVWYVDAHGRRLGSWTCPLAEGPLGADTVLEHLLVQNFIGMPAPLFRLDAFLAAGGMNPELWYLADWDLWLSLARQGTTRYIPRPLAAFRVHAASQTIRRGRDLEDLRQQYHRVFERHFAGWRCQDAGVRVEVRAVFEASTEVSLWLMGRFHGQGVSPGPWVRRVTRLGYPGWRRLWRDSRIGERVLARLKGRWRGM